MEMLGRILGGLALTFVSCVVAPGCGGDDDDPKGSAAAASGGTATAPMCQDEGADCEALENCCSGLKCESGDGSESPLYSCVTCIQGKGSACNPDTNDCCTGMACDADTETCCVKTDARVAGPSPGCTENADC